MASILRMWELLRLQVYEGMTVPTTPELVKDIGLLTTQRSSSIKFWASEVLLQNLISSCRESFHSRGDIVHKGYLARKVCSWRQDHVMRSRLARPPKFGQLLSFLLVISISS